MPGTVALASDPLPAQRGGAKALLLTILGEFVLPADGSAWTTSLIAAAETLGIAEKNARQAIARIGDQGLIEATRHGRTVRWSLTKSGRDLLESGARRIYEFGATFVDWNGEWLVAHCPVTEQQRSLRNQLRVELDFLGFGELSASLFASPHSDREPQLRRVLDELGLSGDCIVLRSTVASTGESTDLVNSAWDLDELSADYHAFSIAYERREPAGAQESFGAVVELVHDWRRFPFIDPELPAQLLPDPWAGSTAADLFHERRAAWSPRAQQWFSSLEEAP